MLNSPEDMPPKCFCYFINSQEGKERRGGFDLFRLKSLLWPLIAQFN